MWARLEEGEIADENIQELLKLSILPNLFSNHPPFQIDGNFGGTAGIAEMLLQSHQDFLHILPALPDSWENGCIKGLKARGGYEVDIYWENGKLKEFTITFSQNEKCRIRSNEKLILKHENQRLLTNIEDNIYILDGEKETYTLCSFEKD